MKLLIILAVVTVFALYLYDIFGKSDRDEEEIQKKLTDLDLAHSKLLKEMLPEATTKDIKTLIMTRDQLLKFGKESNVFRIVLKTQTISSDINKRIAELKSELIV